MDLNCELFWIADLFKKHNVNFWIDSGTLLGQVRDGEIIAGDHDIDISVWASEEPKVKQLAQIIKARGYKIYVRYFRGLPYKYKFITTKTDLDFEIEISIYRRYGEYAWCPLVFPKANKFGEKNLMAYGYGSVRFVINLLFDHLAVINVARWPWTIICKIVTWWVPLHFFDDLDILSSCLPAPKKYEDYLFFRYDRWKVPDQNWNFYYQDGAVQHINPLSLIDGVNCNK